MVISPKISSSMREFGLKFPPDLTSSRIAATARDVQCVKVMTVGGISGHHTWVGGGMTDRGALKFQGSGGTLVSIEGEPSITGEGGHLK